MDQEMEGFTEQGKAMNEAASAIIKWAERYLSSVYDDDAGTVYFAGLEKFILEYQLFFISNYAFMMQVGNDLSQIERIEKFLNQQMPGNEDKLMEFRFMGGTPVDVFLSVESLDDIDIADIYGLAAFRSMTIRRNDRKGWTKKDMVSIQRTIREDLEFDGYEVETTINFDPYCDNALELAVRMKDENPYASFRMLHLGQDGFDRMLSILAGSSDPRVRTMIAGMRPDAATVQVLEKDKDPCVLLCLISNPSAFVHLKDKTIKRVLTTLLKSKILVEDATPSLLMMAKRLRGGERFREIGEYNEEEMTRWRNTWERNTKVIPILEKLNEAAESHGSFDDEGVDLTCWLEIQIEALEITLEDENREGYPIGFLPQ
jgi:hypothetical protein